ncbi:RHS repeat-associated core domain-containing protein [Massilia sp. H-1]|nr:RHS repeat-associated core domain-containing protein [Massilia sp. H-1]
MQADHFSATASIRSALTVFRSLRSVTTGTVKVDYLRNGARQRVTKRSTDGSATHFVFDENGLLLAELDRAGATVTEHIWLAAQPVGVIVNGVAYYVFADHLNTPRLIADTADRARWRWHSNPFGSTIPEENPSGLGKLVYGQRFPGQYYDAESGLHYNYFRDYDPQTGRYVESDPIGLRGGINTYGYVGGNPVSRIDPLGLEQCDIDAARITAKRFLPNLNVGAGPPKADYTGGGWWGEAQIIGRQPHYDGYIHMTTRFLEPLNLNMQARVLENYYHEAGHFTWPDAGHDTIYPYARANLERSWNEYKSLRDKLCKCKK